MTVSSVSGTTDTTTEDSKKEEYLKKYDLYNTTFNDLVNKDDNKACFGSNGGLKELKENLEKKLKELKNAIDNVYDEEKIDELMEALAELITGSSNEIGLDARIGIYKSIVAAKDAGTITDDDYKVFLSKLNSDDNLTNDFKENVNKAIDQFKLRETEIASTTNQTSQQTKIAALALKVVQSGNMYKELEIDLKADEELGDKARSNENLRRFKDDGIWESSLDRREQILQEKLQEEAARKARNEDK